MTNSLRQFFMALPTKLREEDKVKHMVWSFWLTLAALVLWPAPLAFAAVFLLGLVKECWDYRYGSGFCLFDMMGNFIGSSAGLLCGLVFFAIFEC
ncbi:hypothetical protein [Rhodoferax ferrireducens]|uniref:hypothetical protein n=1 Tax=Rhodoferax ferrireducens TaxID=192843 RepID=UPI000E0DEE10|nr:hypothetical protein [Rhodoferax ferrireducens]